MKFCDYKCVHAAFPQAEALDGSGSCRTFQAVYCALKGRIVHKNMPCRDYEKRLDNAEGVGLR